MTGDAFLEARDQFDLVVNVDSFTEIDQGIAKAYWSAIEARTPLFMSINHEHNAFTVRALIRSSAAVKQSTRTPYWMRRGYVEEIVEFASVEPDWMGQIAALEYTVAELKASTSWKATAPLRRIASALRKLLSSTR